MDKEIKKPAEQAVKSAARFTKKQLLSAARFQSRRDALGAVLSDDKEYTIAEAEKILKDFMKGRVK